MSDRPAPATALNPRLGGTVVSDTFLAGTAVGRHKLRVERHSVAELLCRCGRLIAAVMETQHGRAMVSLIIDQPSPGSGRSRREGQSMQVVWLDEVERVPACVCECGRMSSGSARTLARLQADIEAAPTGTVLKRPLHPRSSLQIRAARRTRQSTSAA